MKIHKIQVRNKPGAKGKITVGANTEVLLDGKPLKGAKSIKIQIQAKKVAKVVIELYAEVEADIKAFTHKKKTAAGGAVLGSYFRARPQKSTRFQSEPT
jgi:hypothetical protein